MTVGDELLVRKGDGFEPTPHAAKLLATLGPALDQIAGALDLPRGFDPSTANRNFHLSLPDYVGEFLLPRLCGHLRKNAPNVTLSVMSLDDRKSAEVVAYEGVELYFSTSGEASVARPVQSHRLISDIFMVLMRRDHPSSQKPLTLDDYLRLNHIKVTGLGNGIDRRLAQMGLVRQIVIKVPTWLSVLSVVETTDLVGVIPKHWTSWPNIQERFFTTPLPLDGFSLSIDARWHPRNERDSGHQWFRSVIENIFSEHQTRDGTV